MSIALYQPDIPQNAGNILRLAACLGLTAHVVGPAGFDISDRSLRRAGMDYLQIVEIVRHVDWNGFAAWRAANGGRLVLLTTRGATAYTDFAFT
ncbi:MAG: TrmH family RNA methyltransferase, partial [Roseibium sp.]|uniref:tRNA (cytidine(34)-2'-O)-methyltransferase n=1 Tax=Roseibium sp. TaxID=1936156 RepID=UPI00329831AF